MTLTTRIMIWIGIIITLGLLSVIVYQQVEINKQQNTIRDQLTTQKNLIDGIVRSQSTWASKDDMKQLLDANGVNSAALSAIQKDLDGLKSTLTAVNVATANSKGQTASNIPTTVVGPKNPDPVTPVTVDCPSGGTVTCPNSDPFGYQLNEQDLALSEDFGSVKVPFGTVRFSAWQSKPWGEDIKPREYNLVNVVGSDENQRLTIYNKFSIKVDDKNYEIPLTSATTEQVYPAPKFEFFNPRLHLGIDSGVNVTHLEGAVTPDLSLQIMSYGKFKNQPDLSILSVGGGYNTISKTPELVITPFQYNIGQHFSPVMNNLYVGPSVQVGTDGNFAVGAGLKVGL